MHPNEQDDLDGRDPAQAQPPAHELPPAAEDAPLTTRGMVPAAYDPEPPADDRQSGVDDEIPASEAAASREAGDAVAPPSEAEAIGYDDPSVSPVEALRQADASADRPDRG